MAGDISSKIDSSCFGTCDPGCGEFRKANFWSALNQELQEGKSWALPVLLRSLRIRQSPLAFLSYPFRSGMIFLYCTLVLIDGKYRVGIL